MAPVLQRVVFVLAVFSAQLALAVQPYVAADKVAAGELKTVLAQVENKLAAAGFQVVGKHQPVGLPQHGSLVLTDPAMLAAVQSAGGQAIVAATLRVGVQADGTVSYMNPEYWYRAFLRQKYGSAESAVKALQERLAKTLGAGAPFGGDVAAEKLPEYRYMWGMERFDDANNQLASFESFEQAVATLRDNLNKQVGGTAKVYEIVLADRKLAVFGVAMNDPATGEGWWVNKVGAQHIAALPWEIYVIDKQAGALQGRYRTALAWPSLSMSSFMGISSHPGATHDTLKALAIAAKK